jgi:hypothetical protein
MIHKNKHEQTNRTLPFSGPVFFSFSFFQVGRTPCLFSHGELVPPYILVLRWGSVNKLRLRRPQEFGRPGNLDGCFTAPEESVDRILQLQ